MRIAVVRPDCQARRAARTLMSEKKPLIAIVDDDPSVCRALKRLVRSIGMNAETFATGREFVDLVEAMPSFHADCVVLDIQMPGLNGLEVQERMVRSGNPLPIIFITAHDDLGVRQKALAAGAVAFVRKPFNDELFIKTLSEALRRGPDQKPQGSA